MAVSLFPSSPLLPLLLILAFASTAHAFGAGNIASISKIEGANWRHGDIEDTLLSLMMAAAASGGRRKKFDSMTVKRVYFGNWLRDYSQAIDTGALKFVEGGTVRILLWILSFMTFGYATGEFEVTAERLGCYRPEEHIDNPKDYNENQDARRYDRRLRGPVDEVSELAIDPQTGMKSYIAQEGMTTRDGQPMANSATLVRRLFTQSIELGRRYAQSGNQNELYEALRLLGTGLHCLEDFSAHSNYTELALIELGERGVFPHVGEATAVNINGRQIWPLVTGTFGGVDFLHSVMGEVNDKAIQSEVEQLEESLHEAQKTSEQNGGEGSILRDLLNKFNIGGSEDLNGKATTLEQKSAQQQQQNQEQSKPWGLGPQADQYARDLYPYLEFHDQIMKTVSETMEAVGLSALQEQLAEAASVFVFSLIAPYLLPLLQQVKAELTEGSSEIIGSSKNAQHIVFHDAYSSNPTHSMLSKDHFTNVLNEPAGKIASAVVRFAVPLLMDAWDNTSIDPNQVCDEIIGGVFHHPAFVDGSDGRPGVQGRQAMFAVVQEWWGSKSEQERQSLRQALSREGVQAGRNHKGHDTGHGCGKKIHRTKPKKDGGEFMGGNVGASVGAAIEQAIGGGGKGGDSGIGGLLGGLAGAALGFGGDDEEDKKKKKDYEKKEKKKDKDYEKKDKKDKEKDKYGTSGYGQRTEIHSSSKPSYDGGYESHTTTSYGGGVGGGYGHQETHSSYKHSSYETTSYGGGGGYGGGHSGGYHAPGGFPSEDKEYKKKSKKHDEDEGHKKSSYGGSGGYGGGYDGDDKKKYKKKDDDEDGGYKKSSYGGGGYDDDDKKYKKKDDDDEDNYDKKKKKEEKKYKKKDDNEDDGYKKSSYGGGYGGGYDDDDKKKYKKKDDDDEDDYDKKKKKEEKKYKKQDDDDDDDGYKKKYKKKDDDDDDDDYKKKKEKKYGGYDSGEEKKSKKYGRNSPEYGRRRYDD